MSTDQPLPNLYFRHPVCLEHDPREQSPFAPERPLRLEVLERHLRACDWMGWSVSEAPAAHESQLELVHGAGHVERMRRLAARGGGAADSETWVGARSFEAARRAAGAACEMTRALIEGEAARGFCGVRPPGHHAERECAMGFCLFNNVAVAAEFALTELGAHRVFVLDWDVHHGNGTAEAFRERPDVLYASLHEAGIFPGTGELADAGSGPGEGYTINLPVPAGSEEELWLSLIEHVVIPAARAFEPDLVLISAGFDAHRADPLASARLRSESFAAMACRLRLLADELGAPLGAVLEGGYEPDALARSVAATLAALDGKETAPAAPRALELTGAATAQVGRYWPL